MPDRSPKSGHDRGFQERRGGASDGPGPADASDKPDEAYEDTWYRSLTAFRSASVFGDEPDDDPAEEGKEAEAEDNPRARVEDGPVEVVDASEAAPIATEPKSEAAPAPPATARAPTPTLASALVQEETHVKGSAPRIVSRPASAPIVPDRSTQAEDAVAWRQLKKAPPDDREHRIERLAEHHHDQLVRMAMRNASSLEAEDREMALDIAGRAAGSECVELATKALKDPEPSVRRVAARALELLHDPSAVRALGKCAEDPDPAVRIKAVCALGVTDHEAVLGHLFGFLADPDPKVREKASEVLTQWSSPAVAKRLSDVLSSSALRGPASELLVRMGPSAVGLLVNVLMVGNASAAPAVGRLLAKIAGLDAFTSKLSSPTPDERSRSVEVLGAIGGPKAVDALLGTLADPDPRIRARSLTLLGELADERAIKAMEQSASSDPVPDVAKAARDALVHLRQKLSA